MSIFSGLRMMYIPWIVLGICLLCGAVSGIENTLAREAASGAVKESVEIWSGQDALYIADAGNHWVFAVDRRGNIVWQAGSCGELGEVSEGLLGVPGFVQITRETVVVADVAQGVIVEYGSDGKPMLILDLNTLRVGEELPEIRSAFKLAPDTFLVAERNLHVVTKVVGETKDGRRSNWKTETCFGTPGESGRHGYLCGPMWAIPLQNGNIAIVDSMNHRVIETDSAGNVVRQHGNDAVGTVRLTLANPTCIDEVGDGQFLICDPGNRRIIQVNGAGKITWELKEIKVPENVLSISTTIPLIEPIHAVGLASGSVLITDRILRDIYEVNPSGELVWSYSLLRRKHPELPSLGEPWMSIPGQIVPLVPSP